MSHGKNTFSGFPLTPTRVPRLVKRLWDAVRETDSREKGEPSTSNVASRRKSVVLALLETLYARYLEMHRSCLVPAWKEVDQRNRQIGRISVKNDTISQGIVVEQIGLLTLSDGIESDPSMELA